MLELKNTKKSESIRTDLAPEENKNRDSNALLSDFMSRSYPSYKLELRIKQNYLLFLEDLEEKIKKDSIKDSCQITKKKNKISLAYTTKGVFLIKPKLEVKIKIKRTDSNNFYLSLKGKPLSYSYQTPERYINKLLLSILSPRDTHVSNLPSQHL